MNKKDEIIQGLQCSLRRALDGAMEVAEIPADAVLLDGGLALDSMVVLRFVNEIEEEFDFHVDDDAIDTGQFADMGALASYVRLKLKH